MAPTRATPSAPELPSPEPGGASLRVVSVNPPSTGNIRSAAISSGSLPCRVSPLTHAQAHRLDTSRVIQPDRRQLLSKYPRGSHRIGGNRNACNLPKRLEETEAGIPGDAGHGRRKVVPRPEDATQERGVLELANRDLEPRGGQPRLQHLFQRPFPTAHREQLETRWRGTAPPQLLHEPPRRVGCER